MSRSGIMLCYPFSAERLEKWPKPYFVQPKLDGDRCRAIFNSTGHVTLLSSECNIITSVPHINAELENMGLVDVELDGELYKHGLNHQSIHGIVSRTVNIHPTYQDAEYHVFDYVSSDDQLKRITTLIDNLHETAHIKRVHTSVAENLEQVVNMLSTFSDQGYEGLVVRHLGNTYVRKRSNLMMKFKPRKSDYYVIVGFEEEVSIHGELKNSLGALWLSSESGERFKVGTGPYLTRERRRELWVEREKLLGLICHVKYQHLTERHVPRFPVLMEIIRDMTHASFTK